MQKERNRNTRSGTALLHGEDLQRCFLNFPISGRAKPDAAGAIASVRFRSGSFQSLFCGRKSIQGKSWVRLKMVPLLPTARTLLPLLPQTL